jgi:hypothetical protein
MPDFFLIMYKIALAQFLQVLFKLPRLLTETVAFLQRRRNHPAIWNTLSAEGRHIDNAPAFYKMRTSADENEITQTIARTKCAHTTFKDLPLTFFEKFEDIFAQVPTALKCLFTRISIIGVSTQMPSAPTVIAASLRSVPSSQYPSIVNSSGQLCNITVSVNPQC